jgi:hypothetical protein
MTKFLLAITTSFITINAWAQPFALSTNFLNGSPYNCTMLEDLGVYKRLRVQATQNASNATWELPALCSFPGNVWRPYTAGTAAIPFNAIIPPVPNTAAALYNSNNGGASGNLSPVVQGNYYTFNVQNIATPNSPFIGVLETNYLPLDINGSTVSQNPLSNAVLPNTAVVVSITNTAAAQENMFVRYTTNNWTSSQIVPFSFSGNTGTAQIPGLPAGTLVRYYVYSSSKSKATIDAEAALYGEIVHDMSTLEWNTNISQNYTYQVSSGPLPVRIDYLNASGNSTANVLKWKVTCTSSPRVEITLWKGNNDRNMVAIYTTQASDVQCRQPFSFTDANLLPGANYYRVSVQAVDETKSWSPLVIVNNKFVAGLFRISPNPVVQNELTLQTAMPQAGRLAIVISSTDGKPLAQFKYDVAKGFNQFSLPLPTLAKGNYLLSAWLNQQKLNQLLFFKD